MNYYTQGFARLIKEIKISKRFESYYISMFIHNDVTYSVSNKFQEKKYNTSKDFCVFFVQNRCNIEIYKSVETKFWR